MYCPRALSCLGRSNYSAALRRNPPEEPVVPALKHVAMNAQQHDETASFGLFAVVSLLILLAACPSCSKPPDYLSANGKRGWKAYRRQCTICHADPFQDSMKGPAISGSSEALLRARVVSTGDPGYPKGHKPKRDTKEMHVLPAAVPEIPYLYAYLKELRKPK